MAVSLPIVGRAAELETASAVCAHVAAGQSQVLLIPGEGGIGKSRLVEEVCARTGSAAGGAQIRIGESAPRSPGRDWLRAVRGRAAGPG